ncbi:MAG: hypothetical protein ACE5FD_12610, partial [Anaerolineae bacterium]
MSFQIWQDRWQALDNKLGRMITCYETGAFPRQKTILSLARRLRKFGGQHFDVFYRGFTGTGTNIFELSKDYPPEFVLGVILEQIANDIEVIERAAAQRMTRFGDEGGDCLPAKLDTADKLAFEALRRVTADRSFFVGNQPTVLTYSQKFPNVRVIPYAPVALIGIPFTAETLNKDLLAIPHEVGHFVYRHGLSGAQPIYEALLAQIINLPQYAQNWREEIFADVFGCLVGGPVMGIDFQDLLLNRNRADFAKDEGTHPIPFLRPFLYTAVLNNQNFPNAESALDSNWQNKLTDREVNAGEFDSFSPSTSNTAVSQTTGKLRMSAIMNAILNPPISLSLGAPWTADLPTSTADVKSLYSQFDANLPGLIAGVTVTEFDEPNAPATLWQDVVRQFNLLSPASINKVLPTINGAIPVGDPQSDPNDSWIH